MSQSLRRIIVPTWGQALGCLSISFLTLVILYRDQIWQRLTAGGLGGILMQVDYSQTLADVTNSSLVHTLVIVLFWSAVGLVAYTVVWSLVNVVIEARNEVVLETEYTNHGAFWGRLRVPAMQLGLAIAMIAGLFISSKFIVPYWLDLVSTGLAASAMWLSVSYFAIAVLGGAVNLYGLLLLGQLVFWVA
ncbi:MAG TPA: hypothetical protein VLE72_01575 [Candidatus Saccharimonadales bacterium]|nr:hypothetical protein [Candidatus Saccharimonadales bacterium]